MSNTEKTFFIIKPEAFSRRAEIKSFIESHSKLRVRESEVVVLSPEDIRSLYIDDIGTDLLAAAQRHLSGREVEIGIVEGENAVEEFVRLCGRNPDGNLCDENTIRKVFGKRETVLYDDTVYYLNAIHKSSPKEAAASVRWYYGRRERS